MTYDDALNIILNNNENIQEALLVLESDKNKAQIDIRRRLREYVESKCSTDIEDRKKENEVLDISNEISAIKNIEFSALLNLSIHFLSDIYEELELILKSGLLNTCNSQVQDLVVYALIESMCDSSVSNSKKVIL